MALTAQSAAIISGQGNSFAAVYVLADIEDTVVVTSTGGSKADAIKRAKDLSDKLGVNVAGIVPIDFSVPFAVSGADRVEL